MELVDAGGDAFAHRAGEVEHRLVVDDHVQARELEHAGIIRSVRLPLNPAPDCRHDARGYEAGQGQLFAAQTDFHLVSVAADFRTSLSRPSTPASLITNPAAAKAIWDAGTPRRSTRVWRE